MPVGEIILQPEEFLECAHCSKPRRFIKVQAQNGLGEKIRQQSHQGVHLNQRHIDTWDVKIPSRILTTWHLFMKSG